MNKNGALPVTHVIEGAYRRFAKRLALPLIGSVIVFGVVGCASQSSNVGSDTTASTAPATQVVATKPVAFTPTIGAPAKISKKLNAALVAAAGERNVPVATKKEAEYTVRGYVSAKPGPTGTKLACIWDIEDSSGKRVKRFTVSELISGKKGGNAWALVDDAALQRVAGQTMDKLTGLVPSDGSTAVSQSNPNKTSIAASTANRSSASPRTTASTRPHRTPSTATSRNNNTVLATQTNSSMTIQVIVFILHLDRFRIFMKNTYLT